MPCLNRGGAGGVDDPPRRRATRYAGAVKANPTPALLALALLTTLAAGCGDPGGGGGGGGKDTAETAPRPLGASCHDGSDCLSGTCLTSEYGTPFCTRACASAWEPCDPGEDAGVGEALCVSFDRLPNASTGPFRGDLTQFCAPRCSTRGACRAISESWEVCDVPKYLGDPLFPSLGGVKVCESPSFHGKEPVDPELCDWEKTVAPRFTNEANLCRSYCAYLERCKVLPAFAELGCCEWGCYNRAVVEDEVQDAWHDAIKCAIETSAAYPASGPVNACTEPPKQCGPSVDPTPPAAR